MTVLLLGLIAANTTTGVAAQYIEADWGGNPLYCDRDGSLIYAPEIGPWVAMPRYAFESGAVQCGDWIQVSIEGFPDVWGHAWDSGDLHTKTFRGGMPVVVDVPEYWATWDRPLPIVKVTDWSAVAWEYVERGYCD